MGYLATLCSGGSEVSDISSTRIMPTSKRSNGYAGTERQTSKQRYKGSYNTLVKVSRSICMTSAAHSRTVERNVDGAKSREPVRPVLSLRLPSEPLSP